MNVYQKLAEARKRLKAAGLKPSGRNKGVGFSYFDLQDILPQTTVIESELGLLSTVSFAEDCGTLTVINTEKPEETICFTSPMREAELRGCHPVQNLGAMETYVRRYLYLLAYEIVETEALDLVQGRGEQVAEKTKNAAQNVNDGVKSKVQTKLDIVNDIIKGSEFDLGCVNDYIVNKWGEELAINDLSDEQFTHLVTVLRRNVKKIA